MQAATSQSQAMIGIHPTAKRISVAIAQHLIQGHIATMVVALAQHCFGTTLSGLMAITTMAVTNGQAIIPMPSIRAAILAATALKVAL